MGHRAIFLVGDYTAMIGDPSERETERRRFTHEEVLALAETYTDQAFRILDPRKTEVRHNSEWLSKLTFADLIDLASIFPLKQIIARRDFQDRMARGDSLRFHEALYALMQGYDALALDCDVQVGAYDQHFNMLAGRTIQEHYGKEPHVMVTNPLLTGTDGRKMSKSYDNTINIREEPFDMYGKTMRITDALIPEYLELASSIDRAEVDRLVEQLRTGVHPMDVKKRLAFHLVSEYHGEEAAREAEEKFLQVVQKKEAPDEVPGLVVPADLAAGRWVDLLAGLSLTRSKGEARRLMVQGGFYVNQEQVTDAESTAAIPPEGVLVRLGKRRYYRLSVS
jgi:tyrosyl-tRNA synthetase